MTPLRVVFDTNAFDAIHFDLLEHGPMRGLCRRRRIEPIYGHVFVEETLRAYGNDRKREDLIRCWLPFIRDTCDRICNDFIGIWHEELIQGRGPHASIFMSTRDYHKFVAALPTVLLDGSWNGWHASEADRLVEEGRRVAQRTVSATIRREMSYWRKVGRIDSARHKPRRLGEYFNKEVDGAGREWLPKLVMCKNPNAVAERWSRAKARYPYFTCFVKNMLYIEHYAATRPSASIDLNAQAELDLTTHLLRADVLVSNERGFLPTAFEDLWRPRGKVIFTSQQFATFIAKL